MLMTLAYNIRVAYLGTESNIWLFILDDKEDLNVALHFVVLKLTNYKCETSKYVPCKVEMLNNNMSQSATPKVQLLFF